MKKTLKWMLCLFTAFFTLSLTALDGWTEDFENAKEQAKKEKKLVFMLFTGSDWCPGCIRLEKDILSTKDFKKKAPENYVLFYVDFPMKKKQDKKVKEANQKLQQEFAPNSGYPTVVIIDPEGNVITRFSGYNPRESVRDYLKRIKDIAQDAKKARKKDAAKKPAFPKEEKPKQPAPAPAAPPEK